MSGYYWDEALPEIIEDIDWSVISREQWEEIGKALDEHVNTSRDFMPPVPSSWDLFEMNERHRRDAEAERIASLERQLRAYNDDIIRVKGGAYTSIDNGRVVIHDR